MLPGVTALAPGDDHQAVEGLTVGLYQPATLLVERQSTVRGTRGQTDLLIRRF